MKSFSRSLMIICVVVLTFVAARSFPNNERQFRPLKIATLDIEQVKMWLAFLASRRGQDLLRVKGVLHCAGRPQAGIVHGIHDWLDVHESDQPAPDTSRLVIIGRDLDHEELDRGWAACAGS